MRCAFCGRDIPWLGGRQCRNCGTPACNDCIKKFGTYGIWDKKCPRCGGKF